jgi:heme-degrading monooxygenase HmoA
MILEIADIRIKASQQAGFDAALLRGVEQIITKSTGYISHQVHKCIETPERYVLMIYWKTLENHTIDFRQSPAFQEWRSIVGPFFASPPSVEHFTLLTKSG